MWFGNLVTMEWWTHLWLNEGFARFMENLAVNELYPHWNIWDLFVNDVTQSALSLDARSSSHPIQVDVVCITTSIKPIYMCLYNSRHTRHEIMFRLRICFNLIRECSFLPMPREIYVKLCDGM